MAGRRRVDAGRLDDLLARARREVDGGGLPNGQLAVGLDGELVAHETLGAPPDARFVVFSVTKAVTAGAVWLLFGEGGLSPDDRVADHLREFATHGKDAITVEQLLTHEAGIPRAPLYASEWSDREARRARFAEWHLNWEPGSRVEYHATSAHWVLAELIHEVTGTDHRDFVTERLCRPLGLERLRLGVPPDEQGDVVDVERVGSPPTPDELEAVTGLRGLDLGEVTDTALLRFNEPAARAAGVPGAGAVSTAGDVARYLQALLHDPGGLWDPEVLADGPGRVRPRADDGLLGIPANRTRGLLVAGDDGFALHRGMGRTTSPRAFGHHGVGGQIAWADPDTGLSFCFLTGGLEANPFEEGRRRAGLCNRAGALTDPPG